MELIALDVEAFRLGVADFDALVVGSRVECAFCLETGFGRGCGDQCDDSQPIRERSAAPVLRDVAEQTVLDLVPLRRAGRIAVDLAAASRLDIVARPIRPAIELSFGFFFPANRPRSALVNAFVKAARSAATLTH